MNPQQKPAGLKVRIEHLPPMWVASVLAHGEAPEEAAWRALREWTTRQGLWSKLDQHPIFGFNNPSPSPGTKEYGYELWIQVPGPGQDEAGVVYKHFPGGRFAVTACTLADIGDKWRMLWEWVQGGPHRWRRSQELERVLNPQAAAAELRLELYLPVEPETRA